jgi:hypothetical protein
VSPRLPAEVPDPQRRGRRSDDLSPDQADVLAALILVTDEEGRSVWIFESARPT